MLPSQQKLKNLTLLRWIALGAILTTLTISDLWIDSISVSKTSYTLTAVFALSNILISLLKSNFSLQKIDSLLLVTLTADLVFLTALLQLNGSAHNPFTILFLAIASVGALVLSQRSLIILILATLSALWVIYSPLPLATQASHTHHMGNYPFHLQGMWLANSIGVLLVCSWIYYLRRLNEKMFETQKNTQKILSNIAHVESLGRIVAEAAHRMNTPLGTLQLGVSELQDQSQPISEDDKSRWLEDMQYAVNDLSSLISKIKSKSNQETITTGETVDWFEYVDTIVKHWSSPRKCAVDLDWKIQTKPITQEKAEDLNTLLTALLDNAYEAMPSEKKPIEVRFIESNQDWKLHVKDQGCGMSEDLQQQASEPLFTTKTQGTGLGLYVCHQIAKKHQGQIIIESKPQQGTQVKATFRKIPNEKTSHH